MEKSPKTTSIIPSKSWEFAAPEEMGVEPTRLERGRRWLDEISGSNPYRVVIVRYGRIIAEWIHGMDVDRKVKIYSAVKSVFGNLLGIAIAEGRIQSADTKLIEVLPEFMEVTEGHGPKTGRYAFEKDREITFRQLISNTSGYMKPDENPGEYFHYQTFGMNILSHALAALYGYWDSNDPEGCPGPARLIEEKIGNAIGAHFNYSLRNFEHPPEALKNIFGYYTEIETGPRDAARLGLLWLNRGRWADRQIVPSEWIDESIRVNSDIKTHHHEDMWRYGYGIWSNEYGKLWMQWNSLPKSAYSACGAHGHFITVFPKHELVVVQNPGPFEVAGRANPELLRLIYSSIVE